MATLQPFSRSPKRRNANAINILHTAQQNSFELSLQKFRSTLKNYNNQNRTTKNSPPPLILTNKLNSRQRTYNPASPSTPKPFLPLTPPLTPTDADQSSDAPHANNKTKPPPPKPHPSLDPLRS
ncbi:uncharacterized protein K444DRAFT_208280 [Hyaloscypha bicolor E]|uniref:Uncharacterized protein n=1 Tax=Hyaloscypha bicolor E TaxID=1095630 RepID=A0A2J6TPE2_9HELO|nr:uncharacterized protein K444DRAFT_208280 [Hyaloscypha bicolor E]PMD64885.1 hypothetical protein K444DRAFT_208280 [Hyaloscypha bicolor E]